MNNISRFLSRFDRRSLLIGVAVLLLLFNLVRWLSGSYEARQAELESNLARLEQYGSVTGSAKEIEEHLGDLVRQKTRVEKYFFTGENGDKIASAMQIKIQSLISRSGMQSESIRPIRQKAEGEHEKGKDAPVFGEVVVKARLTGTLTQFMGLINDLYRGEEFFKIENFSLKAYKTGLKIFIDLRGYYILPEENKKDGAGGLEA